MFSIFLRSRFQNFLYLCNINIIKMAKNRYPEYDEEDGLVGMCSEPPASYTATGSGYVNSLSDEEGMLPDDYDPGIGPYTMDELNARIDYAEELIAQAEKGDYSNWVTSEEMDAELYREFPWLR